MKPSKLITIISTFSKKDWKEFIRWSRSIYEEESTGSTIIKILHSIKNINRFKTNLDLHELIKKKSDLNLSKGSLANALTALTDHLDTFLAMRTVLNNKHLFSAALIEGYATQGVTSLFHDLKNTIKVKNPGFWEHYNMIKTEYLAYYKGFYNNYEESGLGLVRLSNAIQQFNKDITDFVSLEMLNRSIVLGEHWTEDIARFANPQKIRTQYTKLFEKVFLMRENEDESAYQYLRNEVIQNNNLEAHIVEILMVHITSFLNRQFKKGAYDLADDVLEFYIVGVRNGYYLTDGKMSARRFLNIVNTACSLDKQEWAANFAEEYAYLLEKSNKKSVLLLCESAIHFADGNFEKIAKTLNVNRFRDFDLEYRARLLKLQTNVELEKDNPEYIKDEIRSFHYYIKRNQPKMSEATLEGTRVLLKYLDRLLGGHLTNIETDLEGEKYLMLGRWLRKTIREKLLKK